MSATDYDRTAHLVQWTDYGWITAVQFLAQQNFSLCHKVQTCSVAQQPTSYPSDIGIPSLSEKWLQHEANHSLPSSAEADFVGLYLHSPCQHGKCLVKSQDNFTFYLDN
jgi:hypothetical protein